MQKLPPIEKVYEAWTALADGRVSSEDLQAKEGCALVTSSDGAKEYTVTWKPEPVPEEELERLRENGLRYTDLPVIYTSNDNATYWQGYAGYPIIAVLMAQGKLTFDQAMARAFSGIAWTSVNEKYKHKYDQVMEELYAELPVDAEAASSAASAVLQELGDLRITVKRGSQRKKKQEEKEQKEA